MPQKTVAQKMLIRPGARVLILGAPPGYARRLGPLPKGATRLVRAAQEIDVIQVFIKSRKELEARLPRLKGYLAPSGALWLAYPKGSTARGMDISRDVIWRYARTLGLGPVALIAIDETWSAMRLKRVWAKLACGFFNLERTLLHPLMGTPNQGSLFCPYPSPPPAFGRNYQMSRTGGGEVLHGDGRGPVS
jgi:hypothetical protein